MGKVIDFNSKMAAKQENEGMAKLKKFFLEQFGNQSPEVKAEIMQAIQDKDEKRYMEITKPIIMKNLMKQFN